MARKASAVAAALLEKGMESANNHHTMFRLTIDGVTTLVTRISHGAKEVSDSNGGKMANQCALRLKEFWALVDCTLTAEEWDRLVRERCADGHNPFMPHR